jgi:hypothetical protein
VPKMREYGYTFVALGSDGGGVRNSLLSYVATLKAK